MANPIPNDAPVLALPAGRMLAASVGAAVAVGGGWAIVCWVTGRGAEAMVGVWGVLIVSVAMAAGLFILGPWKPRPIDLWMSLWMGGLLVRFGVTIGFAYLLYSATAVSTVSFTVGVGAVYFAALLSEVSLLAHFVNGHPSINRPAGSN